MRKRVERVVEEVPVGEREEVRPVEVGEDPVGHRLGPASHQDRPDQAEHEEKPDRAGEGVADVLAHAELVGENAGPHPPRHHRNEQEERGDEVVAAFRNRREGEAVLGCGRLEREIEEIPQEDGRVEVHEIPVPGTDHREPDESAHEREDAVGSKVDRAELGVPEPSEEGREARAVGAVASGRRLPRQHPSRLVPEPEPGRRCSDS